MTDLVDMIVEEAVEEAIEDREIELARDMIRENMPIETIIRFVRLDKDTIIRLKDELDTE